MIAALDGTVAEVGPDFVVVNVGGVGYQAFCSASTLRALPEVGEQVALKIETHVRQDHIRLYGFSAPAERHWFRALQGVQGVGARVALAILSAMKPSLLAEIVATQDPAPLTQANGVGLKLAKRITGELKDALPSIALDAEPLAAGSIMPQESENTATRDAVSALVNLGYGRAEAFSAVATAAHGTDGDVDTAGLIRGGLAELAR